MRTWDKKLEICVSVGLSPSTPVTNFHWKVASLHPLPPSFILVTSHCYVNLDFRFGYWSMYCYLVIRITVLALAHGQTLYFYSIPFMVLVCVGSYLHTL